MKQKPDSRDASSKANRKTAADDAGDKGVFKTTAFGRRRVITFPRFLAAAGRLVSAPFVFLYRRLRPAPPAGGNPARVNG